MPHSTAIETTGVPGTFPTKTVNNKEIQLYPLETIDYGLILSNDPSEKERLLKACQHPGFFYLDFRNDNAGKKILKDLEETYDVEKQFFEEHQPAEKMRDIEIRHDDVKTSKGAPSSLPEPLHASLPLLTRLSSSLREANIALLQSVYPSYLSSHSPSRPSDTALDLIYAPTKTLEKDAPDTTHTDGGTITILCSESWGLKVEDPESKEWGWCVPGEGKGLVNVADSLMRVSEKEKGAQGKLHSCRHAVSQVGDGLVKRYYAVHYLRPEKVE